EPDVAAQRDARRDRVRRGRVREQRGHRGRLVDVGHAVLVRHGRERERCTDVDPERALHDHGVATRDAERGLHAGREISHHDLADAADEARVEDARLHEHLARDAVGLLFFLFLLLAGVDIATGGHAGAARRARRRAGARAGATAGPRVTTGHDRVAGRLGRDLLLGARALLELGDPLLDLRPLLRLERLHGVAILEREVALVEERGVLALVALPVRLRDVVQVRRLLRLVGLRGEAFL